MFEALMLTLAVALLIVVIVVFAILFAIPYRNGVDELLSKPSRTTQYKKLNNKIYNQLLKGQPQWPDDKWKKGR